MSVSAFATESEIIVEPLTRDLFEALVDMGKFEDVPVELIEGGPQRTTSPSRPSPATRAWKSSA